MPLRADSFDRRALDAYYCAPMADTQIPDHVDARKIFVQQALIEGDVPLSRLPRFRETLNDDQGQVQVHLQFLMDDEHRRVIEGKLTAQVHVLCQRCLEPAEVRIEEAFSLALVETEAQMARLPKRLDPWFCEDTKLMLADLIDEQLILAMPIVSYHENPCTEPMSFGVTEQSGDRAASGNGNEKANPFDILRTLKDKH